MLYYGFGGMPTGKHGPLNAWDTAVFATDKDA
jgi:hypothetical protein